MIVGNLMPQYRPLLALPFGILAMAVALSAVTSACAQTNMAGHDMSGMQLKEIPAPDKLAPPVKMTGIGNSHITITATPDAQLWFDQGLNLLHDFWDYESERAFEESIRVDPQCAMCFWGLEQALLFRHNEGSAYSQQALASAVKLKSRASKQEQLYIEAAIAAEAASTTARDGSPANNDKEVGLLRQLVKEYPNDPQAKIFLSSAIRDGYTETGEPKKGTKEGMALLQDVLKTTPNDSAANHYWIHAVEPGAHPEQALQSSATLASLAPASGHMVHMPGHIFYRVGNYAEAEHWFAQSTAVDERYMRDQHIEVDDDWNYVHNLMYGIANLMEEGKLSQATTLSARLSGARGQLSETLYIGSPRDGIARLDPQLPVAMRTGDWAHVLVLLQSAKTEEKLENLSFLAGQLKQFAAGMQAAQTGDLTTAQTSSTALDVELWRMSQRIKDTPKKKPSSPTLPVMATVMPDAQAAPLLASLSIMSLELRATILAGQKHLPESKKLFDQAMLEEGALGYREPPTYIRPVGETAGFVYLQAGDFADAHASYAAALKERPKSGFGFYGMARSSEAAGNTIVARGEYAQFLEAWKNGDPSNPEFAHAQHYMATTIQTASSK
jgi:tetratricopeptide (TPR) repeat protein